MPTLSYKIKVKCLNCGEQDQETPVRRGCRWVDAGQTGVGSGYYRNNDPSEKVKKQCSFCGCDALVKTARVKEV